MNTEKIKKFLKKNLKWIILFICLVLFFDIARHVFRKEIMKRDIIGYQFVSTYFISDFSTPIAKCITQLGGVIALILFATILFIAIKDLKIGICIYLNLFLVGALNQALKYIIQRPRPNELRLIYESGYSFPSGHSMASTAFYGFLIYLIYKKVKNKTLKITLIIVLSLLIVAICVSRIYLGVHYTSDVLGGFLLSISYLTIFTNIIDDFIGTSNLKESNEE